MFFRFLKLNKWYQITQSITYVNIFMTMSNYISDVFPIFSISIGYVKDKRKNPEVSFWATVNPSRSEYFARYLIKGWLLYSSFSTDLQTDWTIDIFLKISLNYQGLNFWSVCHVLSVSFTLYSQNPVGWFGSFSFRFLIFSIRIRRCKPNVILIGCCFKSSSVTWDSRLPSMPIKIRIVTMIRRQI